MRGKVETLAITCRHPASKYGNPVVLVNGEVVSDADGIRIATVALGWRRGEIHAKVGKSKSVVNDYIYGVRRVPAEVWNVILMALEDMAARQ